MDVQTTLLNAMKISISEIFETMFYMPVEFDNKPEMEAVINASSVMAASISFSGVRSGHFKGIFPVSVLKSIASAFMGVDESKITPNDMTGTIGEIVNMIAGNTLTVVGGDFHLELPEILNHKDLEIKAQDNTLDGRTFVKTLNGLFSVSFDLL